MILFYFRSDENGNWLFPAFLIEISHGNVYVDDLRILESIELYLNSVFYAKHSSFVKAMNSQKRNHYQFNMVLWVLAKPKRS